MSGFLSKFTTKLIPIIRIHGSINHKMTEEVAQQLDSIKPSNVKALAISINSPGGMPAQADIISNKLRTYANKHHLPLYTFAESLCASAGYYILCSGDQAFADRTSIVGSIGAIAILFRFKELLQSYGIQVRKFTSSEDLLLYQLDQLDNDPQRQRKIFQPIIQRTRQQFVSYVQKMRGSKLKGPKDKIFDGSVWLGEQAEKLGLVDGLGHMIQILAEKYPDEKIYSIETKKTRLQNFTKYIMGSS